MPSKGGKFEAELQTRDAAKGVLFLERTVNTELGRSLKKLRGFAVNIYQAYAPKKSGRLARGIRAVDAQGRGASGRFESGLSFAIVASARNRKTGYDYVAATRFGHYTREILPGPGKTFLKWLPTDGRRSIYTRSVTPAIVTTDWADAPARVVQNYSNNAAAILARRIGSR